MAYKNCHNNNYQYNNNHKALSNGNASELATAKPLIVPECFPPFLLHDYCKNNNEKKVKELVRKLCCLSSLEVEPIVNYQDQTGRVSTTYIRT